MAWRLILPISLSTQHSFDTAVSPEDAIPTRAVVYSDMPVAIVGMAGRFPGAANIAALWTLVVGGESGLTLFSDAELRAHALTPDTLKQANL
ncbi:beta-ketoacyl synthase N-terminal-like domain-containing protein [Escherichia coli]|uniref:beta-ketoacyl synthase N-terminal-like domain-containing protein n=1 Tax=Escherichia coli TaxID=562 RepID=UPI00230761E7|nr:beta-ketoacyl synthase N-terminal-like domain-containing protein [Escherichia coli]WCE55799.1 beta-ketoacyl synthase N-terminal-like domain-containing protein [Escherichia coli]